MIVSLILIFIKIFKASDDEDQVLNQFIGEEIKIFFAAYSHEHLANNMNDNGKPFMGISKYINAKKLNYNDLAKITRNGDRYEITIGDKGLCRKDKTLVICEDENKNSTWKLKQQTFGYTIQAEGKCVTKSGFFDLNLVRCVANEEQVFSFKRFIGIDKCDEMNERKKEIKGEEPKKIDVKTGEKTDEPEKSGEKLKEEEGKPKIKDLSDLKPGEKLMIKSPDSDQIKSADLTDAELANLGPDEQLFIKSPDGKFTPISNKSILSEQEKLLQVKPDEKVEDQGKKNICPLPPGLQEQSVSTVTVTKTVSIPIQPPQMLPTEPKPQPEIAQSVIPPQPRVKRELGDTIGPTINQPFKPKEEQNLPDIINRNEPEAQKQKDVIDYNQLYLDVPIMYKNPYGWLPPAADEPQQPQNFQAVEMASKNKGENLNDYKRDRLHEFFNS